MPLIPYQCDNCSYYFEVTQGYTDKRKKKCPQCKKNQLKQVFCAPYIPGEIKSLGSIAEKNTREMGRYTLEEKNRKNAADRDRIKLDNLKEAGIVRPDATELPKESGAYKKLKPILNSKEKVKNYIEKGIK